MKAKVTIERFGWSLSDISDRTGLSLGFLRNEARSGRLATRRFGRRLLVIDEELQRYLRQGSTGNVETKRPAAGTQDQCLITS